MSKRIIQLTEDGSHTIALPAMHVTYHSTYGAIQESKHIFINEGLHYFVQANKSHNQTINIFEVGFGTGLNALLSLQWAMQHHQKIMYETIEPHPLKIEEASYLNYPSLILEDVKEFFLKMHACEWNVFIDINPLFSFKKINTNLLQFETPGKFHVIYFDAFDPTTQPELWTEDIFKKMFDMLHPNGILTTYCSKGIVRRAMQSAGFTVEKLKGPIGKREIVRAVKIL